MHTSLKARPLVLLAVLGLVLAGCGGGGKSGGKDKSKPLMVDRALKLAPKLKTASVRGTALPVGKTEFVLDGKEQSIFVLGSEAAVRGARPGEKVIATGGLRRLEGSN